MKSLNCLAALIIIVAVASGCGSSRTTVHEGYNASYKSSTIVVQADSGTRGVQVDQNYRTEFERDLRQALLKKGFREGTGLTLKYWFSDADTGSQSARYWLGPGAGTGKLQIAVEYYDVNGTKLSVTDNEGTVSGGFFGGSFSEAIKNSADAISTFAQKSYLGRDSYPAQRPAVQQPQSVQVAPTPSPPAPSTPPPAPDPIVAQPSAIPASAAVTTAPATPAPSAVVPAPNPGLKTWQIAVNTIPSGALIKVYDANQNLYQIGKSPAGFLWPLQTQADAMVIFFQGRQVTLLPNAMESVTVDFSKQPPEVKGATIIDNGGK